jgi:predicted CoA-binding protein
VIVATDDALRALLTRSATIAMVGASANPARPSAGVFHALRRFPNFMVTPINPALDAIDGVAAFPTLDAYAGAHGAPDIVDVFRNPADAPQVARDAIAVGARSIWFQLGVVNEAAIAAADAAGLDVVVDRCLKVEAARLLG